MKAKTVKGIIATKLGIEQIDVTIRAEKTGNFTTISLADDNRENINRSTLYGYS